MHAQWRLPGRRGRLGVAGAAVLAAFLARAADADGPRVRFREEVKPILESACIKCHAHGQKKGGFRIDSRELWLQGGESGPAAQPGNSEGSLVVRLIEGREPDRTMPMRGPRLTAAQVAAIRVWIDQGMPWEAGVQLGRGARVALAPRQAELPPGDRGSGGHPVDRLLAPYYAAHGFKPPGPVEDRRFARRVSLDVTGLLPAPETLREFMADRRPDKRARLVRQFLADNAGYAEHWLSFWNDLLRNDYRGTGYIDGGRRQITPWLYGALATNLPFDRFVAQLVNPDERSEGFTKGIVWRGVVNASQRPEVQAAQNLSQVFLGINLKCASCHDSLISDWKLADAYGLASIYAEKPLELVRWHVPTGQTAARKFLYPELGAVIDSTNRSERLRSLAQAVTCRENGRLTRTMVNRFWARLLGRGLVEPVDEMDNPPWNADLLDWLADDLAGHGYDLKRTLELILTSRAYALPSVAYEEQDQDRFVFRGPAVRRLSAEQFLDALAGLTGSWRTLPANEEVDFRAGRSSPGERVPAAKWIWATAEAAAGVPPQTLYLRRTFALPAVPGEAALAVAADNRFTLYVNGKEAASHDAWQKVRVIDLRPHLAAGTNVLAVAAVNDAVAKDNPAPNPAGFIAAARLRGAAAPGAGREGAVWDLVSDSAWLCSTNKSDGWEKSAFEARDWKPAVELGPASMPPWESEGRLEVAWSNAGEYGRVRVGLAVNDALMSALGRPNREQVMTSRPTAATTLQALELTNGATLAGLLHRGAEWLAARPGMSAPRLIGSMFDRGLGRPPTRAEKRLALECVGKPLRAEGVEDLLWTMLMLPEFQLVY